MLPSVSVGSISVVVERVVKLARKALFDATTCAIVRSAFVFTATESCLGSIPLPVLEEAVVAHQVAAEPVDVELAQDAGVA